MVQPFNSNTKYSFRGTCELVALTSCNGTEPEFAVRVDFLSDTDSNGAVGVFVGGALWISREDGSLFSDVQADPSSSMGQDVLEYPGHDVTVTLDSAEQRRTIEVGGRIQVTVRHVYGGKILSLSISLF